MRVQRQGLLWRITCIMNTIVQSLSYISRSISSLVGLHSLAIDHPSVCLNFLILIEVYPPRSAIATPHLSAGVGSSKSPELIDGAGICLPGKRRYSDNFADFISVDSSECMVVHILRTRSKALIRNIWCSLGPSVLGGATWVCIREAWWIDYLLIDLLLFLRRRVHFCRHRHLLLNDL